MEESEGVKEPGRPLSRREMEATIILQLSRGPHERPTFCYPLVGSHVVHDQDTDVEVSVPSVITCAGQLCGKTCTGPL